MLRPFEQVDVFTSTPFGGNPLAVVLDGGGLTTAQMQRFAAWTNLSESTFVLPPTEPTADYRVRIFTPTQELPFAGHPTLGTCHSWLRAGGMAARPDVIVQECRAGLIRLRGTDDGLAFAAPPVVRGGRVDPPLRTRVTSALGVDSSDIVDMRWADNGPRWVAVLLPSAEAVLRLRPAPIEQDVGVVGFHPPGTPTAIEVRAFVASGNAVVEDPVTGSLNAAVAQWLLESGRLTAPYVASQGTALGRAGRVHISRDADGTVWVGGATTTRIDGTVVFAPPDRP